MPPRRWLAGRRLCAEPSGTANTSNVSEGFDVLDGKQFKMRRSVVERLTAEPDRQYMRFFFPFRLQSSPPRQVMIRLQATPRPPCPVVCAFTMHSACGNCVSGGLTKASLSGTPISPLPHAVAGSCGSHIPPTLVRRHVFCGIQGLVMRVWSGWDNLWHMAHQPSERMINVLQIIKMF